MKERRDIATLTPLDRPESQPRQINLPLTKSLPLEIKILWVNGHPLRRALFRQILQEPLIETHSLQFRGTPVGLVNDHYGCRLKDQHLHVLWLRDRQPRLALVTQRLPEDNPCLVELTYWTWAHTLGESLKGWYPDQVPAKGGKMARWTGDYKVDVSVPDDLIELWECHRERKKLTDSAYARDQDRRLQVDRRRRNLKESIRVLLETDTWKGITTDDSARRLDHIMGRLDEAVAAWHKQYNVLSRLDQIFIEI